ncbi:MAG: 2OG-Fe(II) oxygenase family protein [Pseudomonadota bacterium]
MGLPVIDMQSADLGARMDKSLAGLGFMQLSATGTDPSLLASVFAASEAFFCGDPAVKEACRYRSAAENFGFQGVLEENLDPSAPADRKETFTMRNILRCPPELGRWPSPAFRDLMQAFYRQSLATAHTVQRHMARHLGLSPTFFSDVHNGENVTLRLLYYPSAKDGTEIADRQMGAGAHTDYGFLTLLFQQDEGGLEVLDAAGDWTPVQPIEGAVVVNSGDLLERWTNGRYKSTMHRVRPQRGGRARFSIAMFIDPDTDAVVQALPSCVTPANPARYQPITAGAHLQSKLAASHKGRFDE